MESSSSEFSEVVNVVLDRLTAEPVCRETKQELLATYLRENAMATLRSLPTHAFLRNDADEEEEKFALLGSIRGLSEKESIALYNNCTPQQRKVRGRRGVVKDHRLSLKMNGARRMDELPKFIKGKNCEKVHLIRDDIAMIRDDTSVISDEKIAPSNLVVEKEEKDAKVAERRQHDADRRADGDVMNLLSQVSIDSCLNELSSASSEFFPH